MRTAQELFDISARHLLTQNARSLDANGSDCLYRGPDGRMCALGPLISDLVFERYPQANRLILSKLLDEHFLPPDLLREFGLHADLLRDLQNVHDGKRPDEWLQALHTVALVHGLSAEACR